MLKGSEEIKEQSDEEEDPFNDRGEESSLELCLKSKKTNP
jgi:hypothetical protein